MCLHLISDCTIENIAIYHKNFDKYDIIKKGGGEYNRNWIRDSKLYNINQTTKVWYPMKREINDTKKPVKTSWLWV